jgi:hypothetical protein
MKILTAICNVLKSPKVSQVLNLCSFQQGYEVLRASKACILPGAQFFLEGIVVKAGTHPGALVEPERTR